MHCVAVIVSKEKLSDPEIYNIMKPFDEYDFYGQYYDPVTDDSKDIPEEAYPEFTYDYFSVEETKPFISEEIDQSYTIISENGEAASRTRWNGNKYEDHRGKYNELVDRLRSDPSNKWMTVIDYHY